MPFSIVVTLNFTAPPSPSRAEFWLHHAGMPQIPPITDGMNCRSVKEFGVVLGALYFESIESCLHFGNDVLCRLPWVQRFSYGSANNQIIRTRLYCIGWMG